jgi:hypothetical protein
MMKKVVAPNRAKPKASSLVLALLLANFYFCLSAYADPPPTAQQHFAVTVFDVAGNATATQHFAVNVTDPNATFIKLSSDKPLAALNVNPTLSGVATTDVITLTTETNWKNGFSLDIAEGASGSTLVCASGDSIGEELIVTNDAVTDLDMNSWGVGVGIDGNTIPNTWHSVSITPLNLDASNSDGSKVTYVYYGAKMNYQQPACESYIGSVFITAGVVV